MNKTLTTAANLPIGKISYESPAVSVVEILSEGVLCQSGQLEEWEEDIFPW